MNWNLIPIASYVFFGLFVAMSIVNLVFCFLEMEKCRKATKCFTTLFLGIAAIIAVPTQPFVYLGVLFGMIGDFCLLKKHKVLPFVGGMLAFLAGHIFYIVEYMLLCGPLHYAYYVATALYCVLFPILFYQVMHRVIHQRYLAFGATAYLGFLLLGFIWAIIACCHGNLDYCLLCVFGAAAFLASDFFLARTLFKKDVRRRDFYIMSTYLIAQGLIIVGMVMTVLMK